MHLSPIVFLIVCPLVFLAGIVDAIGGGGGLISLPAYLFAGLPPHTAIATNKLSSTCGTSIATIRFARQKLIYWKQALPAILTAIIGSYTGARLSLVVDEKVMVYILYGILPISAFFVLNKQLFQDQSRGEEIPENKTVLLSSIAAFVIGVYDGFYGPGTGTFLIIAFTLIAKMSILRANSLTKAINLTTNVTSLVVFLLNGKVLIPLGIAAAICNMLGGFLGAELAISKGGKITRPIILLVLGLLLLKILL